MARIWPWLSFKPLKVVVSALLLPLASTSLQFPPPHQHSAATCNQLTTFSAPDEFPTCHRSSEDRAWTHTGPCYANDTRQTEFCVFASTTFAGGRGIAIVTTARRAAQFAQKDAFTNPETAQYVNREEQSLPYHIVTIPGKGYGLVATRPLNRGDLIMSTTASVMIDYDVFTAVSDDQAVRLEAESVRLLPEPHRSRFLNLSTHSPMESRGRRNYYEARVAKILATNAFDIEASGRDGGKRDDAEPFGLFAVFPEISRINHDCRPNADYYFDDSLLAQHVHAVRPIAAGEEISISYIDLIKKRKPRVDMLHKVWGFQCQCSRCTQSKAMTTASDARIEQIMELQQELQDHSARSRATPQMAELLISLYQQERLDVVMYEAYAYAAHEWSGVGEPWLASKYARLALEYGLISTGSKEADIDGVRSLAEDPWTHWSWMLRTNKRLQSGRTKTSRMKRRE